MHSENYQTSNIELTLRKISSNWIPLAGKAKKLPLKYLTDPQIRKIGDNTHSKGTSIT